MRSHTNISFEGRVRPAELPPVNDPPEEFSVDIFRIIEELRTLGGIPRAPENIVFHFQTPLFRLCDFGVL